MINFGMFFIRNMGQILDLIYQIIIIDIILYVENFENNSWYLSYSSHFSFFVLVDKSYGKSKIFHNSFVCFFIIFRFHLACLALQTENIVQKITQPIFIFGNFVNQNEKRKMGWKAHKWSENANQKGIKLIVHSAARA